jgi:hypothetical protein
MAMHFRKSSRSTQSSLLKVLLLALLILHVDAQRKLSGVIHLEDIHQHWYCSRPEPGAYSQLNISHPLPVLNPLPVQGKARPRGALGGIVRPTNTRRLPSAFELPLVQSLLLLVDLLNIELYIVN